MEILQSGEIIARQNFSVNLFATGESNIEPVAEADLVLGGSQAQVDNEEQLGLQEFWALAAFLALLLLLIEWFVYHRRLMVPTLLQGRPQRSFTSRLLRSS